VLHRLSHDSHESYSVKYVGARAHEAGEGDVTLYVHCIDGKIKFLHNYDETGRINQDPVTLKWNVSDNIYLQLLYQVIDSSSPIKFKALHIAEEICLTSSQVFNHGQENCLTKGVCMLGF